MPVSRRKLLAALLAKKGAWPHLPPFSRKVDGRLDVVK
jgi:hypothetical protein